MINKEHWASCPRLYQAALKAAAAEANVTMQAEYDHKNPLALGRLLKQGVKLQAYPKDVMVAAQRLRKSCTPKNRPKPAVQEDLRLLAAPRNTQSRWFSVAEGPLTLFKPARTAPPFTTLLQSTPLK